MQGKLDNYKMLRFMRKEQILQTYFLWRSSRWLIYLFLKKIIIIQKCTC